MSAAAQPAPARLAGVIAPVLTPFRADLSPDAQRLARHSRWLLADGCSALAPFGTTSEANSQSADERIELLDQLVQSGIAPAALMPGTGTCALTDTVRLTRHAVSLGCAGVLMLPPFYYKTVSEEGLYRSYSEVIERVGDAALRVYLYHIPPVAQVGIPLALIERLRRRYPRTIAGLKDSSGDWSNTRAVLSAFADRDFSVFAGSEVFLLATMRAGGAGCISANANVNAAAIDRLYRAWHTPEAERMHEEIAAIRGTLEGYPLIAALKATLARHAGDPQWARVRPPLVELSEEQARALAAGLDSRGLRLAGLEA